MKRKIDLVEEEHESEHEVIKAKFLVMKARMKNQEQKMFWVPVSQAVSEKRASDLLHSMAASKDILFWTPSGQLLRNKSTIPVKNITELVEYVLLLHDNEITEPPALNTFLDGLAESGIDESLIKNKKLSSDLIEKEKDYRNVENTPDNESKNEESSSDITDLKLGWTVR